MKARIRLFAVARQLVGSDAVEVELPSSATVADVRAALAALHPQLAAFERQFVFAVNAQYAADGTPIAADADIACIPPVSGG